MQVILSRLGKKVLKLQTKEKQAVRKFSFIKNSKKKIDRIGEIEVFSPNPLFTGKDFLIMLFKSTDKKLPLKRGSTILINFVDTPSAVIRFNSSSRSTEANTHVRSIHSLDKALHPVAKDSLKFISHV